MTRVAAPTLVRWQDALPQPWRNGGGVTRELLAGPPGADWQWRISVADIDRSGPFSAFPGVSRWFAVLSGDGVELSLPHGPVMLQAGPDSCAFDGADAPGCRLLGGPTRDLNLMLRAAEGRLAPVQVDEPWAPAAAQAGLFALVDGWVEAGPGAALPIPPMSLLWWAEAPTTLRFQADRPPAAAHAGWWLAVSPHRTEAPR